MAPSVRRRFVIAASYVALTLVSCGVRYRTRAHDAAPGRITSGSVAPHDAGEAQTVVPAVDRDQTLGTAVRIAYREFAPSRETAGAPVLLVHGSPGHWQDFVRLGPLVAARWRAIAPDLPGFGESTHALPDYSFRAHARYMLAMIDRLGIRRVHVVGYSMGGGVVLNMIDLAPERVASLTLLSAIGVQEMELTGSYYVNHLVHGVQLGGLLFLREATPHMGLLDGGLLGVEYARNFYDSDQRPLRAILQRVQVPTLILHGDTDPLVPREAALEHHRLVPQSELVMLPSNHFMPFAEPDLLVEPMMAFWQRVEEGSGLTRNAASAPAREAASVPFARAPFPHVRGIAATVTILVIAGFSAVLPEWGAVSAGVLLGQVRIGFLIAAIGLLLGVGVRSLLVRAVWRFWTGGPEATPRRSSPHVTGRWRAMWLVIILGASAAGSYAVALTR